VKFLSFDIGARSRGAVVRVALSGTAANVMLLDDFNLSRYKAGHAFEYFGGHATRSPVLLAVPRQGHWTVVVDLGGGGGQVNAQVSLVA
jgi:hypothetical protein